MKELLRALQESPDFQVVMDEALAYRPVIPEYKPGETIDETANIIERIKFYSAQRQGFDALFQMLSGRKP